MLAADLAVVDAQIAHIRLIFLGIIPIALLFIAIGAQVTATRALSPIAAISARIRRVSRDGLRERLEPAGDAEFAVIVDSCNEMLVRLERSFEQASRFSSDASHELKTPIAVMQATLERALADSAADPAAVYAKLLELLARQQTILSALLLLSQADSGRLVVSEASVDFSHLTREVSEDLELLAASRSIDIGCEIAPNLQVRGDDALLRQAIHNVLSNAVNHNIDGGSVSLRLCSDPKHLKLKLKLQNTGPPIQLDAQARLFQRFARGPQSAGLGIGLSLGREIARAHGGDLELVESDDTATTFSLTLPVMAAGSA